MKAMGAGNYGTPCSLRTQMLIKVDVLRLFMCVISHLIAHHCVLVLNKSYTFNM